MQPANARSSDFQANTKNTLLRASMVVTYYIKLFRTGSRQTQRYFNVSSPSSRRDSKFDFDEHVT